MVSLSISSCSLLVLQNSEGLRSILASRDDTLLFYILLCCLLIYALLKWRFSSDMIMYGKSIRNAVLFKRYHTQKLFGFTLPLFLLLGLASIVFGLLAYIYFRFTPLELDFVSPFFLLLFFLLLSPAILVIRFVFYTLAALISPSSETMFLYLKNVMLFTIYLGLALSPLLLLLAFNSGIDQKGLFILVALITGIFMVIRNYRGFQIIRPFLRTHKLYFFIYFCTLEILPLLVLLRYTGIIEFGRVVSF